jgi:hypothetical protein
MKISDKLPTWNEIRRHTYGSDIYMMLMLMYPALFASIPIKSIRIMAVIGLINPIVFFFMKCNNRLYGNGRKCHWIRQGLLLISILLTITLSLLKIL